MSTIRCFTYQAQTIPVNETQRAKRTQHKTSEKARRDQLKQGLSRLVEVMRMPCCRSGGCPTVHAKTEACAIAIHSKPFPTKVEIVDFAAQYILSLRGHLDTSQQQSPSGSPANDRDPVYTADRAGLGQAIISTHGLI